MAIDPTADKRLVKQLITPIYNLAIAIRDLFNDVRSNKWGRLDKKAQKKLAKRFGQFTECVPTGKGTLKTARDKIAAHLDADMSTTEYRQFWESFCIIDILGWIRSCMRLLGPLIDPDIYSWTRASRYRGAVNIMNRDTWEVTIQHLEDGSISMAGLQMVSSPKIAIDREARALAQVCIALEVRLGVVAAKEPDS